jgi:hypothetical protein
LPTDNNVDVDQSGTPLVLIRSSDLCPLFKNHVMGSAMNQIKRPSSGPITFQKEFICTFKMNASHIKMPPNWKRQKVLDANEIASPRLPGVKEKNRATVSSKTTSSSAHPLDDMIQQLIDEQILLAKNLDPNTFGMAVATAVSSTMTSSTGTIGTQVSAGITKAMEEILIPALQAGIPTLAAKPPKISGVAAVATCGSPSNPLRLVLEPNKTVAEFISELPKTSSKIPHVGAWNKHLISYLLA